jgi:hypothetical protein
VIAALPDHLWQSTLFAGVIALLVPPLRANPEGILKVCHFYIQSPLRQILA